MCSDVVRSTGPLPQRLCTRGWWTGYDDYVADQHASLLEWPSLQVSESWPPTLSRYIFHCQIQRLYSGYLVTREISVLMCVWILSLMRTVSLHVFISDELDVWLYQTNSRWQRTIKKKCNVINGNNTLIITMTITVVVWTGISGWFDASVTHDVVHNRTINLHGGLGHNIAMDRICEFLNAEFKGSINND